MAEQEKKAPSKVVPKDGADSQVRPQNSEVLLARAELLAKKEKFSELALPKIPEKEKTSFQAATLSADQAKVRDLINSSNLSEPEKERLNSIYRGKTRVVVAELGQMRNLVEALKKIEGSDWLDLEKKIADIEKKLIKILQGVNKENLVTNALEVSKKQDQLIAEVELIKKERVSSAAKEELKDKHPLKTINTSTILSELGVDRLIPGGIKDLSPAERRSRLLIGRQKSQEQIDEFSKQIEAEKSKISSIQKQANVDTTKQTYGWLDPFFNKIAAEENIAKADSQAIALAEKKILTLSQKLSGHLDVQARYDSAIRVIDASDLIMQGRSTAGARLLLGLKQGQLKGLTEDSQNKQLAKVLDESIRYLREKGNLSEAEKIIFSKNNKESQRAALTAALEEKESKTEQAVDLNEQLYTTQAVNLRFRETAGEYFKKGSLVRFDGKQEREQKFLLSYQLADIDILGDNVTTTVLVDQQAKKAIETKIPEGARLVLLKPVKGLEFKTENGSGRGARTKYYLKHQAYDLILQENNLAYYKDGNLYQFGGTKIDVSKEEHKDFIQRQLQTIRSFGISRYKAEVELRKGKAEYKQELWTLRTQSGEVVPGVRVSKEVQDLLKSRLQEGETVVLKRVPKPIELSTTWQREVGKQSAGRGGMIPLYRNYRKILIEPDQITMADVTVAKVEQGQFILSDPKKTNAAENQKKQTFSSAQLQERSAENTQDTLMLLRENEDLKYFHQASEGIYRSFSNLQEALQAQNAGSAREEFIARVRREAKPVHDFIMSEETKERGARLKELISEVRRKIDKGVALSEGEQEILKNIDALENLIKIIEDPKTRNITETILDKSKFNADTWANFAKNDLPVIVGSIAVAVAAAVTIKLTLGAATPLWVVFFASTAAGAAGGMIGAEGTKEILFSLRNNYDSDVTSGRARYRDRSLAGQLWSEEEIYDEKNNTFRKLTGEEVLVNYSQQFATNFAMQAVAILGSQYLAGQASKFLQRPGVLEKLSQSASGRALIRRFAESNVKALSEAEKLSIRESFRKVFKEFGAEVADEFGDEFWEGVAGKATDALIVGIGASDPGNTTFGDQAATLIVGTIKGTKVGRATFVYNASTNTSNNISNLLTQAQQQGYIVSNQSYGYYSLRNAETGEVIQVRAASEKELTNEFQGVLSTGQLAQGFGVGTKQILEQLAKDANGEGREDVLGKEENSNQIEIIQVGQQIYQKVLGEGANEQAATQAVNQFLATIGYRIVVDKDNKVALEKISKIAEVVADAAKTVDIEPVKDDETTVQKVERVKLVLDLTTVILNDLDPLSAGSNFPKVVLQEETEHPNSPGSFIEFRTDPQTNSTIAVIGMDPARLSQSFTYSRAATIAILLHEYGHVIAKHFGLPDQIKNSFNQSELDKKLNPNDSYSEEINFAVLFEESFADAMALRLGITQNVRTLSFAVNDQLVQNRLTESSNAKNVIDRILKPLIICEACLVDPAMYGLSAESIALLQREYPLLQQKLRELLESKGAIAELPLVMDCLRAGWLAAENYGQIDGQAIKLQPQIELEEKLLTRQSPEEKGRYLGLTYSGITPELIEELIACRDNNGKISAELLAELAVCLKRNVKELQAASLFYIVNELSTAVQTRLELIASFDVEAGIGIISSEPEDALDLFVENKEKITNADRVRIFKEFLKNYLDGALDFDEKLAIKFSQQEAAQIFLQMIQIGADSEIAEDFAKRHKVLFSSQIVSNVCSLHIQRKQFGEITKFLKRNNLKLTSSRVVARIFQGYLQNRRFDEAKNFLKEDNIYFAEKIKDKILINNLRKQIVEYVLTDIFSKANYQYKELINAYQLAIKFPDVINFQEIGQLLLYRLDQEFERKNISAGNPPSTVYLSSKVYLSNLEKILIKFEEDCRDVDIDLLLDEKYQNFKQWFINQQKNRNPDEIALLAELRDHPLTEFTVMIGGIPFVLVPSMQAGSPLVYATSQAALGNIYKQGRIRELLDQGYTYANAYLLAENESAKVMAYYDKQIAMIVTVKPDGNSSQYQVLFQRSLEAHEKAHLLGASELEAFKAQKKYIQEQNPELDLLLDLETGKIEIRSKDECAQYLQEQGIKDFSELVDKFVEDYPDSKRFAYVQGQDGSGKSEVEKQAELKQELQTKLQPRLQAKLEQNLNNISNKVLGSMTPGGLSQIENGAERNRLVNELSRLKTNLSCLQRIYPDRASELENLNVMLSELFGLLKTDYSTINIGPTYIQEISATIEALSDKFIKEFQQVSSEIEEQQNGLQIKLQEKLELVSKNILTCIASLGLPESGNVPQVNRVITELTRIADLLNTLQTMNPERAGELENLATLRSELSALLKTDYSTMNISPIYFENIIFVLETINNKFIKEFQQVLSIIEELQKGINLSQGLSEITGQLSARPARNTLRKNSQDKKTAEVDNAQVQKLEDLYHLSKEAVKKTFADIDCQYDSEYRKYLHVNQAFVVVIIQGQLKVVRVEDLLRTLSVGGKKLNSNDFYDSYDVEIREDEFETGSIEFLAKEDETSITVRLTDLERTKDGYYKFPLSPHYKIVASALQKVEVRTTPWLTTEIKPETNDKKVTVLVKLVDQTTPPAHLYRNEFLKLLKELQGGIEFSTHPGEEATNAAIDLALKYRDKKALDALRILLSSQEDKMNYLADEQLDGLLGETTPYNNDLTLGLGAGDCKALSINESRIFLAAGFPCILLKGPSTKSNYDEDTNLSDMRYNSGIEPETNFVYPGHMQVAVYLDNGSAIITEPTARTKNAVELNFGKVNLPEITSNLQAAKEANEVNSIYEQGTVLREFMQTKEGKPSGAVYDPLMSALDQTLPNPEILIESTKIKLLAIINSDHNEEQKKEEILEVIRQFIKLKIKIQHSNNSFHEVDQEEFNEFISAILRKIILSENSFSEQILKTLSSLASFSSDLTQWTIDLNHEDYRFEMEKVINKIHLHLQEVDFGEIAMLSRGMDQVAVRKLLWGILSNEKISFPVRVKSLEIMLICKVPFLEATEVQELKNNTPVLSQIKDPFFILHELRAVKDAIVRKLSKFETDNANIEGLTEKYLSLVNILSVLPPRLIIGVFELDGVIGSELSTFGNIDSADKFIVSDAGLATIAKIAEVEFVYRLRTDGLESALRFVQESFGGNNARNLWDRMPKFKEAVTRMVLLNANQFPYFINQPIPQNPISYLAHQVLSKAHFRGGLPSLVVVMHEDGYLGDEIYQMGLCTEAELYEKCFEQKEIEFDQSNEHFILKGPGEDLNREVNTGVEAVIQQWKNTQSEDSEFYLSDQLCFALCILLGKKETLELYATAESLNRLLFSESFGYAMGEKQALAILSFSEPEIYNKLLDKFEAPLLEILNEKNNFQLIEDYLLECYFRRNPKARGIYNDYLFTEMAAEIGIKVNLPIEANQKTFFERVTPELEALDADTQQLIWRSSEESAATDSPVAELQLIDDRSQVFYHWLSELYGLKGTQPTANTLEPAQIVNNRVLLTPNINLLGNYPSLYSQLYQTFKDDKARVLSHIGNKSFSTVAQLVDSNGKRISYEDISSSRGSYKTLSLDATELREYQPGDDRRFATKRESPKTGNSLMREAMPSKLNGAKAIFIVDAEALVGDTGKINLEVENVFHAVMNSINGAKKAKDLKQLPELRLYARGQEIKVFTQKDMQEIMNNPKKAQELLFYLFSWNLFWGETNKLEERNAMKMSPHSLIPEGDVSLKEFKGNNVIVFSSKKNQEATKKALRKVQGANVLFAADLK